MLGYYVDQSIVNMKAGQAVKSLQMAFDQVETMNKWLSLHPVVSGTDPLVTQFGFGSDEASSLRTFFGTMAGLRTSNTSTFDIGRQISGLE